MSTAPLPPPPTALHAAARALAAGQPREAVRLLDALVAAAPAYAAAHVLLAKAREAAGDSASALSAWHQAYFLVPSSPLVRRERQRLLALTDTPAPSASEPPATGTPVPEPAPAAELDPGTPPPPYPETPYPDPPPAAPAAPVVPPILPPEGEAPPIPHPRAEAGEIQWEVVEERDDVAPPAADARVEPDILAPQDAPTEPEAPDADQPEDAHVIDEITDDAPASDFPVADELDALIRDLENAPRITPDPEFSAPAASFDDDDDDMASETLAQIYAAQHQYAEAAAVYERLALARPAEAEAMLAHAAEMRRLAGS